jgi:predicted metal-dependent HD superfamily phosphohydrolase
MNTHKIREIFNNSRRITNKHIVNDTVDKIISIYGGKDRFYHSSKHIIDGLKFLFDYKYFRHSILDESLLFAWIYHDIIYLNDDSDLNQISNEEISADFAFKNLVKLGCTGKFAGEVYDLIMYTKHDKKPLSYNGKIICDIDLISLSTDYKTFCYNNGLIRKEMHSISYRDFLLGNSRVLKRLLDRKSIYYILTEFDKPARENIEKWLNENNL